MHHIDIHPKTTAVYNREGRKDEEKRQVMRQKKKWQRRNKIIFYAKPNVFIFKVNFYVALQTITQHFRVIKMRYCGRNIEKVHCAIGNVSWVQRSGLLSQHIVIPQKDKKKLIAVHQKVGGEPIHFDTCTHKSAQHSLSPINREFGLHSP